MDLRSKILNKTITITTFLTLFSISFFVNAANYEDTENKFLQKEPPFLYENISEFSLFQPSEYILDESKYVINLIKQNKLKQASIRIDALIKDTPKEALYYIIKATIEIKNKHLDIAKKNYEKSIAVAPVNPRAYLGLSALALEKGELSIAKQHAKTTLKQDNNNIPAHIILAKVATKQLDLNTAEKYLLNAHAKATLQNKLVILKLLSQVYKSNNKIDKILPLVKKLVKQDTSTTALSFLAKIQLANKNSLNAEDTLRKIITLEKNDIKHKLVLAKLLEKYTDKDTEIIKLYDQAIESSQNENSSTIHSLKVGFLITRKKYPEALIAAEQININWPTLSIGKISKGNVFLAEKKFDSALTSYQQAYKIDKKSTVLELILKILAIQNKHKEAIALVKKELPKVPNPLHFQFMLANLYQNTAQYNLAVEQYESLLLKQKDDAIILNNLAWVYNHQQNPKALETAKRAYIKTPNLAFVADTYGYILLKNGNKQESLKVLKRAAKEAPNLSILQLHLSESLIANKKKSQAREILQQLANGNSVEKTEAINLLKGL